MLAEALKSGFLISSPISAMIRTIRDIVALIASWVELDGDTIIWNEKLVIVPTPKYRPILSNDFDRSKGYFKGEFLYAESPSSLQRIAAEGYDPLIYFRDAIGNPIQRKTPVTRERVGLSDAAQDNVLEVLDHIAEFLTNFTRDPMAKLLISHATPVSRSKRQKLTKKEFEFFRRRKGPSKDNNQT
jgi:hypothetical protein